MEHLLHGFLIKMKLYCYKTDFLRHIAKLVAQGYPFYLSGEMSAKPHYKLVSLEAKFDERDAINATAQQRFRRKLKGLANSQLLAWCDTDNGLFYWVLLSTEGLHGSPEPLKDSRKKKQRVTVTGYELKQTPRKDRAPTWSWAMTKTTYEYWHADIQRAIRHRDDMRLRQIWYSLRRVGGFYALRTQVFKLQRYAMSEWKRSRSGDYPFEKIFVGWVGKFKQTDMITLDDIKK